MKKILFGILTALALPLISFAATYDYVTSSGTMATVSADSAAEALAIAPNIALHSGVAVHTDSLATTGSTGTVLGISFSGEVHIYQYVDIAGSMRTVEATSADQALSIAPNIAANSGVALVR